MAGSDPRAYPGAAAAAIGAYHDLLTPDLAQECSEQLTAQLRQRGLFFGDRPLCSVLRPRFLEPAEYGMLRTRLAPILNALERAHCAAMEDAAFRAQFRLFDWEEELVGADPGFPEPSPVSRIDAFLSEDGLRVTEYNAETPAAAGYNDILAYLFLGLPVMRPFLRRWEVRTLPSRHHVLHALLEAWQAFSGGRERPSVGILDWREVPTYSEFVISMEYFRSQGLECVIADPREVEYRNGRLVAGGVEIDVVYKRVLISELVEREGLDHPLVRAVRDGKVCMVNPFRCKILHKKASLAVLSDERNAGVFTAEEGEAIESLIPWTRVVEERRTLHDGRAVDLVDFVARNRDRLVLKPNDEYGGKGIVLGWEVTDEAWEDALATALEEPFIVQERVTLPREVYPSMVDGELRFQERIVDTAPFVFHGGYVDGCLTRLSTESLVNVTAGGGSSLATFVASPR